MSAERELDSLAGVLLRLADDVIRHSPDNFLVAMARQAVRQIPEDVRGRLELLNRNEMGVALAEGMHRLAAFHERMRSLLAHAAAGKEGA